MSAPDETVYASEPPNSNTNSKDDLSGTSSARPTKMGEGRDGPSHCPLPKLVVRSEEDSLKLNLSQEKTANIEQPITLITGVADKREVLPLQKDPPSLEKYHNINSLGFCERARAHLLRDLAKESDNWETDDDYLDGRNELAT